MIKNKRPQGSAILTTMFLMFGILTISMIGLDIIMGGMAARRAQGSSARAFYSAESGAERALSAFKLRGDDILANADCNGSYFDIDSAESGGPIVCQTTPEIYWLLNNNALPSYWVKIENINARTVELIARGSFMQTNRDLYIRFCLPSCAPPKTSGDADDCGGMCK